MEKTQEITYIECSNCNKKCKVHEFELSITKVVNRWSDLLKEIKRKKYKNEWIFRGQLCSYRLKTALERACNLTSEIGLQYAPEVEEMMIREFQRWYGGENQKDVRENTLYCLSLMQHHGVPTRLLDWTYSAFVASYFGVQYAYDTEEEHNPFALWCLHGKWCDNTTSRLYKRDYPEKIKSLREMMQDEPRKKDECFTQFFTKEPFLKTALSVNPYYFHPRLFAQQAVFLCPGDISIPLEKNLHEILSHSRSKPKVIKFCCDWNKKELENALEELRRMNIFRTVLFPGLDGFAQSMKYRLPFLKDLHKRVKEGPSLL